MRPTVVDLVRMGVTYQQLRAHGMNDEIERMFKLDDAEWAVLGKGQPLARIGIKAPAAR